MQGIKHTIKKDHTPYYLTMTITNWQPIFESNEIRCIIIDSLNHLIEKRNLIVYSYCIMHNHLHMIANTEKTNSLKDLVRDFKKFTSRKITSVMLEDQSNKYQNFINQFKIAGENHCKPIQYKVWKDGNHAIELYSNKFIRQKINYIHQNPVKAGYTDKIEDWPFSSAIDYFGGFSVLKKVCCL
jgi:putative transposase